MVQSIEEAGTVFRFSVNLEVEDRDDPVRVDVVFEGSDFTFVGDGPDGIEISRFDTDITQGFKQAFSWISDAGFSGTAGELGYRQEAGLTIVQADRDGDPAPNFEIALCGAVALTEGDFLI
ncbi:hypothetical protein [Salipiger mucosus]|uniref:Alkaline phosphatase n=1 Tax=Salipiger mucosus DSM 16094 TaxID=1123237 RepID=S9QUF5_9RHOB|nr:hypothetical protein [Salipiger mucosus]EPX85006.1 Alkaline phosphatase [Salipiger mucosus DSM 16094]